MRKSTKGALAGVAAVALLMGGFGTHASWNAGGSIPGDDLKAGSLSLDAISCGNWLLNGVSTGTSDLVAGNVYLVPGDVLDRICTLTVTVKGTDVAASLSLSAPTVTRGQTGDPQALIDELSPSVVFTDANGDPVLDSSNNPVGSTMDLGAGASQVLHADLSVSFSQLAANAAQNLTAILSGTTVTLEQS